MNEKDFSEVIKIDKNSLDDALIQQAMIFHKISSELAQAISLRDEANTNMKRVYAELDPVTRDQFVSEGLKIVEAAISAAITTHPDYLKAQEEFNNAKLEADMLQAQKEAFIQRSYMLRELCGLYISGYFTDSAMKANSQTVAEFGTSQRRARMNDKRVERRARATLEGGDRIG